MAMTILLFPFKLALKIILFALSLLVMLITAVFGTLGVMLGKLASIIGFLAIIIFAFIVADGIMTFKDSIGAFIGAGFAVLSPILVTLIIDRIGTFAAFLRRLSADIELI